MKTRENIELRDAFSIAVKQVRATLYDYMVFLQKEAANEKNKSPWRVSILEKWWIKRRANREHTLTRHRTDAPAKMKHTMSAIIQNIDHLDIYPIQAECVKSCVDLGMKLVGLTMAELQAVVTTGAGEEQVLAVMRAEMQAIQDAFNKSYEKYFERLARHESECVVHYKSLMAYRERSSEMKSLKKNLVIASCAANDIFNQEMKKQASVDSIEKSPLPDASKELEHWMNEMYDKHSIVKRSNANVEVRTNMSRALDNFVHAYVEVRRILANVPNVTVTKPTSKYGAFDVASEVEPCFFKRGYSTSVFSKGKAAYNRLRP